MLRLQNSNTFLTVSSTELLQREQTLSIGRQCNVNIDIQMPKVGDMDHGEFGSCFSLRYP